MFAFRNKAKSIFRGPRDREILKRTLFLQHDIQWYSNTNDMQTLTLITFIVAGDKAGSSALRAPYFIDR